MNETERLPHVANANDGTRVLLIIEDFDEIRAMLSRHFVRFGYSVLSASTFQGAVDIAANNLPNAIIVDYQLSGESVIEAIVKFRERIPDCYILLVGCPGSAQNITLALELNISLERSRRFGMSEIDQILLAALTHLSGRDKKDPDSLS